MSSTAEQFAFSADLAQISQVTDLCNLNLTNTTETPILETTVNNTAQTVAQWVYIQAPPKMSSSISLPTNQGVILQPVSNNNSVVTPQHLIIQKPTNIQTYFTMIHQQPQVGASSSNATNQKYVIAPMPQLTTNRLPTTVTTNSVQSKIALMPVTQKLLNIQVNENNSLVTCSNNSIKLEDRKLICDEVITINDCSDELDKNKCNQKLLQGVSILKKNFGSVEKNLVSEFKIATSQNHQKSNERRRKSNVSYRKDFDEEIIVTANTLPKMNNKRKANSDDDVVEIKVIEKKEPDEKTSDLKNALNWDKGVALLPGTDIKFHMNEFGFIEYLKKEEPKLEYDVRCVECGCRGSVSEFITPKFCSTDCQSDNFISKKKKIAVEKRRNKAKYKKVEEETGSPEEDSSSNDNSQDKSNNPWCCKKKGFSWPKYLEHVKAKAAPVKLFRDPFPYNRNGFKPGMKLEGVDPLHPKYFCVLSVAEVLGYRIRLHFDGFSENYDFWVNADSMDIFHVGWCEKFNHQLHPPPGYTNETFNWTNYLKETKSPMAPKHLFANRAGSAICPNGFRIGMKLEAVDRKNTSLICVATVVNMMDCRILVHFDSWDDIYDYWADPTSPYIHPVGWCDEHGHKLTPPNKYPNPDSFTWEKYLKETKSVAAPVRAFKQKQAIGFKKGMRLECVDQKVPKFIRVATIQDVKEHQLLIKFDGWRDCYNCLYENDSRDIHPVGWCQKTGHPIEPPLTPEDIYDFLECPTVGCRGQGNIKGMKISFHSTVKECPYADENLSLERSLPDRLLSPNRQLEAVVPISREPKEGKSKCKVGRPSKTAPVKVESPQIIEPEPVELQEIEDSKPLKRKAEEEVDENIYIKKQHRETFPLTSGYDGSYTEQIWDKYSKCLKKCITKEKKNPRLWTVDEVVQYINSLPYVKHHSALFRHNSIDGEAFLTLNQRDIINILNIKLGPAIKLYSVIMLLRRTFFS